MALGDGGGRAANNGGMSGSSSSTGSRGTSTGLGDGGGRVGGSIGSDTSASPSRSTPGAPGASDGRRGSTMGPSGGSAPNVGTSSNRGAESIRGSRDARTSFDGGQYAVTNPTTARESYRARDMGVLANDATNPVVAGSFIGADNSDSRFSFSPNVRDSDQSATSFYNNKSVEARQRAKALTDDAKNMGLGGQVATTAAGMVLGPVGGLMAEAIRNNMVAGELSDSLQQVMAVTDYSLNANQGDLARGLNTNTLSDSTFGLLGDTKEKGVNAVANKPQPADGMMNLSPTDISADDAQRLSEQSRVNWGSPNERDGSGAYIDHIPVPSVPGSTNPNPSQIGSVGDYASYARNVFSTV